MRFDLNSPEGQLAALEVLGVIGYNEELAKTTSREMVVVTAAGHEIVTAHSSYGLLHYINGTGKAFAELGSAIQFADENPASPKSRARILPWAWLTNSYSVKVVLVRGFFPNPRLGAAGSAPTRDSLGYAYAAIVWAKNFETY